MDVMTILTYYTFLSIIILKMRRQAFVEYGNVEYFIYHIERKIVWQSKRKRGFSWKFILNIY